MWVVPAAACLPWASDLHWRIGYWWGQDRCCQELANSHQCHRGPKFLGIHGVLPLVFPKFSQVAQPLHKLTSGENAGKKKAAIQWNSKCQQAFDDLKRFCTTAPILAYADFTKPFKLHTDACGTGLGAILYQTWEDGTEAVMAYASRSLSKATSHYPVHKLEFLTLKWAVDEKFHEYLHGSAFNM